MISTCFDYIPLIVNVVGASCKRNDALLKLHYEKVVKKIESCEISTGKGKNQEINLARSGETRWGSHYKTLVRLFDMWDSVEEVLTIVHKDGYDEKSRASGGNVLAKMVTFEFVFVAKLMMDLLGMTNELSQLLQAKDQNIGNAIHMIEVVKSNLRAYRENGWETLLKEATNFCTAREIHVPNMEDIVKCRAQRLIFGGKKTYQHCFRAETFMKVIDAIDGALDKRFTETSSELLKCIMCLDPSNAFANFDHERLLYLARLYSEDFSSFELSGLHYQLKNYITDVRLDKTFSSLRDIGELAKKMVEMKYHTMYCLVYRLIELALVLPVATATVERCFSAMNIIKTDLRNRMGDDLLADCLMCYIEKGIFIDIEDEVILQHFQHMKTRRIRLPPISSSNFASSSVYFIKKNSYRYM